MSKTLVIFGATGQQGGSIIKTILSTPSLKSTYTIRAVTRDPTKPTAQALSSKNISVMKGDVSDPSSITPIMKGAHTVFALTTTTYDTSCYDSEYTQGLTLANAAVSAGVTYLIFSSLPHVSTLTGGKYTGVQSFDAKADVETYIRSLPIKSAFFHPGSFMQNFNDRAMKPIPLGDGTDTWAIFNVVSPETKLPLIDAADDAGVYIGAMLEEPGRFEGKVLCASSEVLSMDEICGVMSKVSGKKVVYKQLPEAVFRGFMRNEVQSENITQMMLYIQDFGYYGEETVQKVAETGRLVGGKLTMLEEYLRKNPLVLE